MTKRDILFSTVTELAKMLRSKKISSVELTNMCLDALDTDGRKLNAVAELTRDLALKQAEQADRDMAANRAASPLHGIPWGAKDLISVKDVPSRWGSPAHQNQVFDYDAVVTERLREAGAVLVAKLAMIELAGGGGYDSAGASLTGPCRNPFNPSRWAGGSSSGSGATVGAGLVGFAIGSETWGSITVPAAFCNVCGLRPTYGRVPRYGAMALSWTMDKLGPMARSAEDCGLILQAIAGHDLRDPSSAPGRFRFGARSNKKMRLGLLTTDYETNKAAEARKRFDDAMAVFRKLGHTASEAKLPDIPYEIAAGTIVDVEGASAFENLIRSDKLLLLADKSQQAGLLSGLATPSVDYLRAMKIRTIAAPLAVKVFEQFDALVAPTLLQGSPKIEAPLSTGWVGMGGNGGPGNLLGWPSISIPMGLGKDNLPLGLEIIGAPYADNTILALAMAFQRETDWHRKRPRSE